MIMYAAAAAAGNIFWPLQNLSNIIIIMLTVVLSLYLEIRRLAVASLTSTAMAITTSDPSMLLLLKVELW